MFVPRLLYESASNSLGRMEESIQGNENTFIREHVEPSSVVNTTSRGLGFSPPPKLFFLLWRGEFGRSSGDVMTGSMYVRVHSFMNQASQVERRVLLGFYLIDAGNFRQHEHKNLAISVFLPPLPTAPSLFFEFTTKKGKLRILLTCRVKTHVQKLS